MATKAPRLMGAYARDTATWIRFQGQDNYGDDLTPIEVQIPARVTWKMRRVVNLQGEEVVSSGSILMGERPNVAKDKVRIAGTEYIMVAAEEKKTFSAVLGYTVYLQ